MQETYARVLVRPRFLRSHDDLGYLLRALRNTFLLQVRKEERQLRGDAVTAEADPVDPRGHMVPEREAEARELYTAIAALPEDFRVAMVAVDVTGLSYKEAARALRVPEGTVRSRIFRARERVAMTLGSQKEGAT